MVINQIKYRNDYNFEKIWMQNCKNDAIPVIMAYQCVHAINTIGLNLPRDLCYYIFI